MIGIEFVSDRDSRDMFDESVKIGDRVSAAAQQRGLIVRPLGNMAILSPPLILSKAEIAEIVAILRDSISAVTDDLKREGLF
jgi:adenosylmethionine-8-amino-7-oxononanoate aminotransferase